MDKDSYIAAYVSDMMYYDDTVSFSDAQDRAHKSYERFLNEETFLVDSFIEEDLNDG